MAFQTKRVSVDDTAVVVAWGRENPGRTSIYNEGPDPVELSHVENAEYGADTNHPFPSGASLDVRLTGRETVYAVCDSGGSATLAVMGE